MTIKSGPIDFLADYAAQTNNLHPNHIQVNTYHYDNHFTGQAKELLRKIISTLNTGNFDHSDIQTDYFHVGWYCDVNIGQWDQPYVLTK